MEATFSLLPLVQTQQWSIFSLIVIWIQQRENMTTAWNHRQRCLAGSIFTEGCCCFYIRLTNINKQWLVHWSHYSLKTITSCALQELSTVLENKLSMEYFLLASNSPYKISKWSVRTHKVKVCCISRIDNKNSHTIQKASNPSFC